MFVRRHFIQKCHPQCLQPIFCWRSVFHFWRIWLWFNMLTGFGRIERSCCILCSVWFQWNELLKEVMSAEWSERCASPSVVDSVSSKDRLPMMPPETEETFYYVQVLSQGPDTQSESTWVEVSLLTTLYHLVCSDWKFKSWQVGKTNSPFGMTIDLPDFKNSVNCAFRVIAVKVSSLLLQIILKGLNIIFSGTVF